MYREGGFTVLQILNVPRSPPHPGFLTEDITQLFPSAFTSLTVGGIKISFIIQHHENAVSVAAFDTPIFNRIKNS